MCPHFNENNESEQRLNLVIRSEKQHDLTFRRRTRRSRGKEELGLRLLRVQLTRLLNSDRPVVAIFSACQNVLYFAGFSS